MILAVAACEQINAVLVNDWHILWQLSVFVHCSRQWTAVQSSEPTEDRDAGQVTETHRLNPFIHLYLHSLPSVFSLRFASFQTAKDQATQRRSRETGAIAFSARFIQYSNDPPLLLSVAAVIQVFA